MLYHLVKGEFKFSKYLPFYCDNIKTHTDLALRGGGGHLAHVLLVLGVRCVLGQLVQDVGAGRVCDVQVVGQSCAVAGRAGERMLLVGLL